MRAVYWVQNRPWLMPAFLLGALTGVVLVAALRVLHISDDGIATVLGAGVGAGAGTFGAWWVASSAQRRHERQAKRVIVGNLVTAELHVATLLKLLSGITDASSLNDHKAVAEAADKCISGCTQKLSRMKALEPLFLSLGPWGVNARVEVAERLQHLIDDASEAYRARDMIGDPGASKRGVVAAKLRNDVTALLNLVGLPFREKLTEQ